MEKDFKKQYLNAAKWSTITEFLSKLVAPIINMILARLIAPEAFGVVASVAIITSFADMITDAGFQKMLIQKEFESEEQKGKYANVAFWTNLSLSALIWGVILIFNNQLAELVGSPGFGTLVIVAGFQVILTAFTSIQIALIKREFQFNKLFLLRLINLLVPLVVTIPLALINMSYWAIIIANLSIYIIQTIVLYTIKGWRPSFYYSFDIIKDIFSYSTWMLIESFSIWLTGWIDIFIISFIFTEYQVGLYKTSINMVSSIMNIVTTSLLPVLFSGLSRLNNEPDKFKLLFFKTQKIVSLLIVPMGIGLFLFSDLATYILLGDQWLEASVIIGVWGLTNSLKIVFCNMSSEVYRAKGMPKVSVLAQVLHLVFLIPAILISSKYGFDVLVQVRAWSRIQFVLVNLIILSIIFKTNILNLIKNVFPEFVASAFMTIFILITRDVSTSIIWQFLVIFMAAILYFGIHMMFPKQRRLIINTLRMIIKSVFKKNKDELIEKQYID